MAIKTTNDDVMRLERGGVVEYFTYEEWVCVRYLNTLKSQSLLGNLFGGGSGNIEANSVPALGELIEAGKKLGSSALHSNLQHGNGGELFALIKTKWKLAYRHQTASSDLVKVGTRTVCEFAPGMSLRVPRLMDVSAFRSGVAKLEKLLGADAHLTLSFLVVGPVYLVDRKKTDPGNVGATEWTDLGTV